MKIWALGPRGSYSSQVADKVWWHNYELIETPSNKDTIMQLNEFDIWILPISNKYWGTVTWNMETICHQIQHWYDIHCLGTYNHKINHVLAISGNDSIPDRTSSQIETVYSHPQALLQCTKKIKQDNNIPVAVSSTTAKIWSIWDGEAVICSQQAAESNGLIIVDPSYAPEDNITSFSVMSAKSNMVLNTTEVLNDKIIAILKIDDIQWGLASALHIISELWLNLCFIESVADGRGGFMFPIVAKIQPNLYKDTKDNLKSEFKNIDIL